MGRFEFAGAPGEGAGEGAFFVAEQLAFQQGFGNGGAVQRDERAAGAAGFAVDMAGEHFLAGAGFACDEHGGFGGGDLLGAAQHGEHGGIAHDRGAGRAGGGEEHGGDEIGVRRQEQHVPCAGAHRGIGLRRRDVRAGGDDRHGDALRGQGADERGDIERDVAEDQADAGIGAQRGEGGGDGVGLRDLRAGALREAGGLRHFPRQWADQQQAHHVSCRGLP